MTRGFCKFGKIAQAGVPVFFAYRHFFHGNSISFITQKIRKDIPLCQGKEVAKRFLIDCKT